MRKEKLSEERISRLNGLGFLWDTLNEKWEIGFKALLSYKEREGHCDVERTHLEDGYRLGQWVITQRASKTKLSDDYLKRLNEIGFVLKPHDQLWETGFNSLLKYKEREGHCNVPGNHLENGFRLGQWVGKQRQKKSTLLELRIRRLNELGFVWSIK